MAQLFGEEVPRGTLLPKIGSLTQVGGIRRIELKEGNEKGMEAVDFRTGTGFGFTVLLDRGMDISWAEYCGCSLCWHSSTGQVAPAFYEPEKLGWLRTFYGGLLTTCGLTYAGAPCVDEGVELGLHGRISHIPAKDICIDGSWEGNEYRMFVKGKMRETIVFGENLVLTREISARLGENKLYIHDVVENEGYQNTPLMILYHVNGGYPAVDEGSELLSPTLKVTPRDEAAKVGMEEYTRFQAPTPGFAERVYYHEMAADEEGYVYTALVNRKFNRGRGFGFYLKYSRNELPCFVEWKMNAQGTYVVGIEPSNCRVEGRDKERARGTLQFLAPTAKKEYHLEIGVLTGQEEIRELEARIARCKK